MNTDQGHIPAPADITRALSLVNWRDVVMDGSAKTIYLKRSGMSLDAGGVLKGFAADETARILSSRGVKSAMIDLGGNILAMGSKPDGAPWRIGLQDPDSARGISFGTVENGLVAVTMISRASIDADGWDTTLLCMGPVRGLALAKSLGLDVLLVSSDHKLYATDSAKKMLTITDPSFTYAAP